MDIPVSKEWDDQEDKDGIRPERITVYLYANEKKMAEMELTAENEWKGVFEDLYRYEDGERMLCALKLLKRL